MPEYQIEMLWRCSTCREENGGRHKECQGCGKPLEGEEFYMPGDTSPEAAVTDPELVRQAKAGPDWECAYCRSSQRRDDGTCAQCGASQKEDGAGDGREPEPPRRRLDSPAPSVPPVAAPAPRPWEDRRFRVGAAIAIGASLVALCLWLVFRTRVVDVSVASVRWERRVLVERYHVCHREGWDRDPGSFNERDLGKKVHHYDKVVDHYRTEHYTEQVACGQDCVTVPQTCRTTPRSCTSNKNGFATCTGGDTVCSGGGQRCSTRYCSEPRTREVPVYRDEPVYRTWWAWDVWAWDLNRTVMESGDDLSPFWPSDEKVALERGLGAGEKERRRGQEDYLVTFRDPDDSWRYSPRDEAEFRRFPVGSRHRIKVGLAHGVEVVPGR